MSAFLVSDLHINVLVAWARREQLSWNTREGLTYEDVAQELRSENEKSVNYRYQEDGHCPVEYESVALPVDVPAAAIIKMCDCYEYQSCEHPEWKESRARAIVGSIRQAAVCKLPGYREAPWGLDDLAELGR